MTKQGLVHTGQNWSIRLLVAPCTGGDIGPSEKSVPNDIQKIIKKVLDGLMDYRLQLGNPHHLDG